MKTLYVHVISVLVSDRTDVQVLELESLPSRVISSTPPGFLMDLMNKTGETESVEGGSMAEVYLAAKEVIESIPGLAENFSVSNHVEHFFESIPIGNLYFRPIGGQVSFSFPLCWKDEFVGTTDKPLLLEVPPTDVPGQPRIWTRYHLALSEIPPVDPLAITPSTVANARVAALIQADAQGTAPLVEGPGGSNLSDGMRFTRMFYHDADGDKLSTGQFGAEAISAVADAMKDNSESLDSNIPMGYAFFGQFLTHELTHDMSPGLPPGSVPANEITQGRLPTFDLDSLYGSEDSSDILLFEDDQVHMRVGFTSSSLAASPLPGIPAKTPIPADLPRRVGEPRAAIADDRNDTNLGLAQTHVAFLRLHNRIADKLKPRFEADPKKWLRQVKSEMRKNFQAVSLYDFASRICDPELHAETFLSKGGYQTKNWPITLHHPGMPLEFSVGAFRFGHCLLGSSFAWNDIYADRNFGLSAQSLVDMTSRGSSEEDFTLPTSHVLDWRRFFDFGKDGVNPEGFPEVEMTRCIQPRISSVLRQLPSHLAQFGNLPKLDMWRGVKVGLPSGQDIARAMGVQHVLTQEEMMPDGELGEQMKKHGMLERTPLWLYILREAEVHGNGNHLGEVGSTIVLDTLVNLAYHSKDSILKDPDWKSVIDGKPANELKMADLLSWENGLDFLSTIPSNLAQAAPH